MRILIISKYATPYLYPRHFKIGQKLAERGNKVTLITSTSNKVGKSDIPNFIGLFKVIKYNKLKVVWFKGPKISNKGISRIISWILFEIQCLFIFGRYDIVYTSSLSLLSIYSGALRKFFQKSKWLLEIRDVWPHTPLSVGHYSKKNIGIKFLFFTELFGYKYCDVLIGTMPNLKKRVNTELKLNKNVFFLPQGVSSNNYHNDQIFERFKSKYLPKDRFIVAYIGTMNANNPLYELIELIQCLPENLKPKYWFLFLGRGENKHRIMEELSNYDNVVFPEPVKKKYIQSILKYCHVGYDSISRDLAEYGLSRNKWIDYFQSGTPIICVYEGFQSMINEANFGKYVQYNNIKQLLITFEYYRNMSKDEYHLESQRGKSYLMKNHSFEKLTDKLESWF